MRRTLLLLTVLIMLSICGTQSSIPAFAAPAEELPLEYPTGPITLVVPYDPGGSVETSARAMSQYLSKQLGVTIVIENLPGAAGLLAFNSLAERAADGYTIAICAPVASPWLSKAVADVPIAWEPDDTFEIIGSYLTSPALAGAFISADSPYQTFAEFIRAVQAAAPKSFNIAVNGPGSSQDPKLMELQQVFGIELNKIYYTGGTDMQTALLTGDVDIALGSVNYKAMVENTKFRIMCAFGSKADIPADFPIKGVPMIADFEDELGFKYSDFKYVPLDAGGQFILAKKGIDPRILETLRSAVKKMVEDQEFRKMCLDMGYYPMYWGQEESTQKLRDIGNAMTSWKALQPK